MSAFWFGERKLATTNETNKSYRLFDIHPPLIKHLIYDFRFIHTVYVVEVYVTIISQAYLQVLLFTSSVSRVPWVQKNFYVVFFETLMTQFDVYGR